MHELTSTAFAGPLQLLSAPTVVCRVRQTASGRQDDLTFKKHLPLAALQTAAGLPALTELRLMICAPNGMPSPPGVMRPRCEELARLRSASLRELTLYLDWVRQVVN